MMTFPAPIPTPKHCADTTRVSVNDNGGFFVPGKGYSENKYLQIMDCYHKLKQELRHKPLVRKLAQTAKIGYSTARKAIPLLGRLFSS